MRAALSLAAVLALAAGCAFVPPSEAGPGIEHRQIRARILAPGHGGVGFYVNRPAYVAMFHVVPGQGTSLIYPAPGAGRHDGFTFAGLHGSLGQRAYNRDTFLPAQVYGRGFRGPSFVFMIASERPLELSHFGSFGMGLRSAMGMRFASFNAYNAMEELAELTLPSMVQDGSWTTDLYVHWPDAISNMPGAGRVLLSCNGYRAYVSIANFAAAREALCDQAPAPAPGDTLNPGGTVDSTRVVVPERRAPAAPEEARAKLREAIAASAQLQESRRAELDRRFTPGDRGRLRPENGLRGAGALDRERPRLRERGEGTARPALPRSTERAGAARSAPRPTPAPGARARPAERPVAPRPAPTPKPSESGSRRPVPEKSGG